MMEFKETQAILDEVASFDLQPSESKDVDIRIVCWEYARGLANELNDIGDESLWFSPNYSFSGFIIEVRRMGDS